jgi:hypothetical protein
VEISSLPQSAIVATNERQLNSENQPSNGGGGAYFTPGAKIGTEFPSTVGGISLSTQHFYRRLHEFNKISPIYCKRKNSFEMKGQKPDNKLEALFFFF